MPKPLCFTMRNDIREQKSQQEGRFFSKNDAPLQRQGLFGNLQKLEKSRKNRKNAKTVPKPIFLVPPPPEPPTTFTAAVGTPCAEALPVPSSLRFPKGPWRCRGASFFEKVRPSFWLFFSLRPFGLVKHNGLGTFCFLHF